MRFQKIFILYPQKGLEFPGRGGGEGVRDSVSPNNFNWNFQTDEESMEIFYGTAQSYAITCDGTNRH